MKDYGEPWTPTTIGVGNHYVMKSKGGFRFDTTVHNKTRAQEAWSLFERAAKCVNSCQGVPDSALVVPRAMAKAWLAMELWSKFGGFNYTHWYLTAPHMNSREHGGVPPITMCNQKYVDIDALGIVNTAIEMRELEADFGELNALIDSFKEEA